ncbi:unnamed protein product [Alopecurus aequalis]
MSATETTPITSNSALRNINGVDRLSNLCDELLHHIMSFLPMPEVVRTSLLSPRWHNLWASTPFIYIDYQDFKVEDDCWYVDQDKLEKFGDHLLLLRDGDVCLDEARIYITSGGWIESCVWIHWAIKHKVRLLHVSGFDHYPWIEFFPSQNLKLIRLQYLGLSHDFFMPLNHECPVLEQLELEDCILGDVEISSRSLKVLRMVRCLNMHGLLICARNLKRLSILEPACDAAIVTKDLSSLVIAPVIVIPFELHREYSGTIVGGHRLLDGLSHASTLELHAPLHELALERSLQTCPMFSNLTSLVLGDWCMAADLYPLLHILHRSPNLKELSVKLEMKECYFCTDHESALLSSGATSSATGSYPSLDRIKICCRKDDPRVGALVQALLPIIIPEGKICIQRC